MMDRGTQRATTSMAKRKKPAKAAAHPPPLAQSEHEKIFFEFEQALICASEAFYRFAGAILGGKGRAKNLNGQENVILQQLMFTDRPRGVTDLSRFANRDDLANIQYSLRKLVAAGVVEKAPGSTNRDTKYRPTALGRALTREMVELRRQHLIQPSQNIKDVDRHLRVATTALSLLTGLYDHVSRRLAGGN